MTIKSLSEAARPEAPPYGTQSPRPPAAHRVPPARGPPVAATGPSGPPCASAQVRRWPSAACGSAAGPSRSPSSAGWSCSGPHLSRCLHV